MTGFVAWGFDIPSNLLPPAAKAEEHKKAPAPAPATAKSPKSPKQHTQNSFHIPRWLSIFAKIILALVVAGLCITGIVFLTDFFEAQMGHGGFLPRALDQVDGAGAGHGFGVYDSAGNNQHGAVQPEEWCNNHPGDCHWVNSQVRGLSHFGFASREVVADWPACSQG
ncbi:uncharacterized protein GLRG_05085 [Colletotrichum graminicola M1.001]|uniref:Uncharacterized protein n=1 Tax=Colletotrichum graminicola (strain M1.001 / M2 / FGSC 10212) TaxID=645133 RepID=E3QGF3_COLGM|nr:uncharacterized protein GLRG_05085 [Colletotrichum graminicola M1.001]EFQ29941.1 hypothetical protein GLRG_05085 [Colletotrichum graminicola M1.001]